MFYSVPNNNANNKFQANQIGSDYFSLWKEIYAD